MLKTDRKNIVSVKLKKDSYKIVIDSNIIKYTGAFLSTLNASSKVFIISDANVPHKFVTQIEKNCHRYNFETFHILLKAGESQKSFETLYQLCDKILSHQPDRYSTIIALGGGVVGDLSGFTASMVLRGINFIQIPTTLLSQVDSSVGGKTGINHSTGKNLIGSFYQPKLVLADLNTLKSLPIREYFSGYSEALKYALINQKSFFKYLNSHKEKIRKRDPEVLRKIVINSCKAKAKIVSQDEKEKGARALLNLGHTFGHSLEKETGFSDILKHGEAVAIGTVLAFKYSHQLGLCHIRDVEAVISHLKYFDLPTEISHIKATKKITAKAVFKNLFGDKKAKDGKLTLILTKGIGSAFIAKNIDENHLLDFLKSEV